MTSNNGFSGSFPAMRWLAAVIVISATQTASAQVPSSTQNSPTLPDISPLMHFEAVNQREPTGDKLGTPRRIAAAIVAQDNPAPKSIVDVGSFTGEFLEAFMQRFPNSHGQWTEPVDNNLHNAKKRFARFGDHVDYVIGCPSRDISLGCVPKGVDVLITSWLSIHQDLKGIQKFYRDAEQMLPSGGWLINLEHVAHGGSLWEQRLQAARVETTREGLSAMTEGPPVHHKEYVTPTLEDHIAAFKAAGIDDVQVVWRRLNTVLIMGRKK
jgi:hypothetical protein